MRALVFLLLLCLSSDLQAQWAVDTSFPGTPTDMLALIGNDLFALTAQNRILVLHDSTEVWEDVSPPAFVSGKSSQAAIFNFQDDLYALDDSLKMYKSTDLGESWTSWTPLLNTGDSIPFWGWRTFFYPMGDTLVMVDIENYTNVFDDFYVYYSTDNGLTFQSVTVPFENCYPCSVYGWDQRFIFVSDKYTTVQRTDSIYYTTDMLNWGLTLLPGTEKVYTVGNDMYYGPTYSSNNIVYLKSGDLGSSWDTILIESDPPINIGGLVPKWDPTNKRIELRRASNSGTYYYDTDDGSLVYDNVYSTNSLRIRYTYDGVYGDFRSLWKNPTMLYQCSDYGIVKFEVNNHTPKYVNNGIGYLNFKAYTNIGSPLCITQTDSLYISYDYGSNWQIWRAFNDYNFPDYYGYAIKDAFIHGSDIYFIRANKFLWKYSMLTGQFNYVAGWPDMSIYDDNDCETSHILDEYYYAYDQHYRSYVTNMKTNETIVRNAGLPSHLFSPMDGYYAINEYLHVFYDSVYNFYNYEWILDPVMKSFEDDEIVNDFNQVGSLNPGTYYLRKLGTNQLMTDDTIAFYTDNSFEEWLPYVPSANTNANFNSFNQLGLLNYQDTVVHAFIGDDFFRSEDNGFNFENLYLSKTPEMLGSTNSQLKINDLRAFIYTDNATYSTSLIVPETPSIKGVVFDDHNGDGVQNDDESGVSGVRIAHNANGAIYNTDDNGLFQVQNGKISDTIVPISNSAYMTITPEYQVVNDNSEFMPFAASYLANINDLSIRATLAQAPQIGEKNKIYITVENLGTTLQSPNAYLILSSGINYLSSIPAYSSKNGDTLFWNISTLSHLHRYPILVHVNVDPSISAGSALLGKVEVIGNSGELTPNNNKEEVHFSLQGQGTINQNSKSVYPTHILPETTNKTQLLDYTIRFQNTSKYPATSLRITDTLSPNLDMQTLEITSTSHWPMTWKILPGRVLQFSFEQINLPDTATYLAESYGFVRFKIKTIPTLQQEYLIENNADIFFDFNLPLRTNTAVTSTLSTTEDYKGFDPIYVLPNPNNGRFSFVIPEAVTGIADIDIINTSGQILFTDQNGVYLGRSNPIDTNLTAGVYYLRVNLLGKPYLANFIVY